MLAPMGQVQLPVQLVQKTPTAMQKKGTLLAHVNNSIPPYVINTIKLQSNLPI